ncbi:MAG TPA: glycerophosphodiester phosphodiesterase [Pyrinomonadaceae bacterium]|jgi:glycerophosphoryl diester phosphodiesterase|nr:glycerophosphodiester phosphodiesterase [Pyrinomonadaceae bacterium]
MKMARVKWLIALGGVVLMPGTLLFGLLASFWEAQPVSERETFRHESRRPLIIAHRGGAGLWPENTLYAFTRARDLGVDVLEMDAQVTADGVLVVMHDSTLDRTTDGSGPVNMLTLAQLKKLDAAHHWSPGGRTDFPLRGRGITVPTLQEVFKAFPELRFNIEPKQAQPSMVKPLCRLIRESGMTKRVMVGSFSAQVLAEFREECAEVATSASPAEVGQFLSMNSLGPETAARSFQAQALQVPELVGGRRVITREFIEAAHARKLQVHAWTINDEESMRRLIELGVDGIMTDYPDRLLALLKSSGGG